MKLSIIALYVICSYFLLTAIAGLGNMLGIGILLKLDLILLLSGLYIFFSSSVKKMEGIDILLLIFLLCISLSSAFNNYSTDLFYYGLRYQILLTIFFFVGKSEWFADWKFFDKMQMPIIAVSLIGLYLYLAQPSWYIAWKLQSTTEFSSESRILEMTRLSAFWQYPYWVSYGCALLYHYKLYTMFTSNVKKQDVLVIFFLFFEIGIGRYSHLAYQQNKLAITDCQYIQTLHETGYFGLIGYILLFIYLIVNGMRNIKLNIFEIGVLIFYLIAMIGANPLSNQGIHTIFLWICCGRIINNDCLHYKQNEYEKSNCN